MQATAIILAGGKSSRFGRDKTLLKQNQRLIIEDIIEKCRPLFGEILIVCNQPDKFHFPGVRVVTDVYPGLGPMAGIHAGLLAANQPWGFVIACDMPLIQPALMAYMLAQRVGYQAVIPCDGQYMEPLFALYQKQLYPQMAAMLETNQRCILDLYTGIAINYLPKEQWQAAAVDEDVFFNINYPEDYLNLLNQRTKRVKQSYHKKYYRDFCNQRQEAKAYAGKK